MYSLRLTCRPEQVDALVAELWEAETTGIREVDEQDQILLIAGFETNEQRAGLLEKLAGFAPEWRAEAAIDWQAEAKAAWPGRESGQRLFLAPFWAVAATPPGRERIVHNPGLACGTGEHAATQLALRALEERVWPGCRVVDIGCGSGLLSIAAIRLGAGAAIGLDPDESALEVARENYALNLLQPQVAAGSAECLTEGCADITVANISGTVLLAILDELVRITADTGWLILTGFQADELPVFEKIFPAGQISLADEWACLSVPLSSRF
jgi:ribosomal protein L11 methyltransferase